MKKFASYGLLFYSCCLILISCGTVPPEKYFSIAVLNTNLLFGFANNGMYRQLESPSLKLGEDHGTVVMKRSEIINEKIKSIEESYEKVKDLKVTEETEEIIKASIALYEYVLPVYKNEYTQLAESLDKGIPEDKIQSESRAIHDKYYSGFTELNNNLISAGKLYAEKNNIKVNWGVYGKD